MKWEVFQMCFTGVPSPGNRRSLGVSAENLPFSRRCWIGS